MLEQCLEVKDRDILLLLLSIPRRADNCRKRVLCLTQEVSTLQDSWARTLDTSEWVRESRMISIQIVQPVRCRPAEPLLMNKDLESSFLISEFHHSHQIPASSHCFLRFHFQYHPYRMAHRTKQTKPEKH